MSGLRDALMKQLATLPLVTYSNGYQVQALPKADLLSLLNLHPEEDIKALAETATRLGYELGHKEALAEAANAVEAKLGITSRALGVLRNLASEENT